MANTIVDLKQTPNVINPNVGFTRIKATEDGKLQYIYNNKKYAISSPWELPVEEMVIKDPSLLPPLVQWERHIVNIGALGDFLTHDTEVASWNGVSWDFVSPEEGWVVFNKDDSKLYYFDSVGWEPVSVVGDGTTVESNVDSELTVVGIDHIIDSNGFSIDASLTPMFNPSHELVTRSFVEAALGKVDHQTLEKIVGHGLLSSSSDREDIARVWNPLGPDVIPSYGVAYVNGVTYMPASGNMMFNTTSGSQFDYSGGVGATFYAYSSVELSQYNLRINGDFNTNQGERYYFSPGIFENGLWLHSVAYPAGFEMGFIGLDGSHSSFMLGLIIHGTYPQVLKDTLTINGIERIIDKSGYSIDKFAAISVKPNREIATKGYIDNTKNNVDDVTISGSMDTNILYTLESDPNLFIESAIHAGLDNTDWGLLNGATITGGVLEFPSNLENPGGSNMVLRNYTPSIILPETLNIFVISNIQWTTVGTGSAYNGLLIRGAAASVMWEEEIPLATGEFMYRYRFPGGMDYFSIMQVQWDNAPNGPLLANPYFKFVDLDTYPAKTVIKIKEIDHIIAGDGRSIDPSNILMLDPVRELVTRDYVDSSVSNVSSKMFSTTITALDITNGYIDVGETILNVSTFNISGAPTQSDTIDFQIDGVNDHRVSWNGLGLDGELVVGNVVVLKFV